MKPEHLFKTSAAAAVFAAVIVSSAAMAGTDTPATGDTAQPQSYTINLSATVPSTSFQVVPVDAGWINQTQDMGYDVNNQKLQPLDKQFQYKNSAGAIQATLTGNLNSDGKPQLSNGTDVIPLSVTFNNIAVSKTATEVVGADAAKAGGRTDLVIAQADDAALKVSGSFTGSVGLLFEPAAASN